MSKPTGAGLTMQAYMANGLLIAAGGILATPLAGGPLVLLAFLSTLLMLATGRGTLREYGQPTLHARNILLIAFGAWFCAELLSTAINNQLWRNLDYPFRFMLGIGVFWMARRTGTKRLKVFLYGIAASALAAAALSVYQHFGLGIARTMGWTNYPIYFGNFSVMLCVYAAITLIVLRGRLSLKQRNILALSIPLLVIGAFLSGSRSSWLGLAGMLVLVDWNRKNLFRLIGGGLAMTAMLAVLLAAVPDLASSLRVTEAIQDFREMLNGNFQTSIGYRMQMWKAATLMFMDSPLIGIGSGNYQAQVAQLVASGAIDAELFQGETNFNQPHSEIMDALATKGLVGFAAYLVLLLLPFRLFSGLARTTVAEARTCALMGQATIIAFLMFGLTNATFKIQIYCAVYPLTIAMFAALVLNLSEAEVPPTSGEAQTG